MLRIGFITRSRPRRGSRARTIALTGIDSERRASGRAARLNGHEALAEWEFKLSREGETYQWPELVEQYGRFDVYRGVNGLGTIDFAIGECGRANVWGRDRKYFIVFHITAGFKRPISEFLEADDYEEARELIAIIRGKGGRRKMYDPTDDLSVEYEPFRIETYRDRIDVPGSWNKLAVVAPEDDVATMLNHGLIQAQSRFDIKPC
jgi:hypothetical protein